MTQASERPGARGDLTPCHWGSVNQWECDENDHLNVRYYAHKVNQAVQILLAQIASLEPPAVLPRIRAQHLRFLRESRAATPLRVDCGLIDASDAVLEVLALMHDNVTGEVVAAFQTRLDARGLELDSTAERRVQVPDFARPRGLQPDALPPPPATWQQARDAGFHIVGRGVIGPEECDADGRLLPHGYVGRVSDGMPNLWAFLNPPAERSARASGALGGAALEQRLDILAPLTRGAVFTQLSGVRALGNKTQQMAHVLYDETHDRVAATMEALGVAMDLSTRRAVPISDERRAQLQRLLLRRT